MVMGTVRESEGGEGWRRVEEGGDLSVEVEGVEEEEEEEEDEEERGEEGWKEGRGGEVMRSGGRWSGDL